MVKKIIQKVQKLDLLEITKKTNITKNIRKFSIINESKNCPKCNIIKSITEFHNDNKCKGGKHWCCKECVKLYYKPSKESRRKSDRCCLNCKTSHPLASFEGKGRICENCRQYKTNLVAERKEYFNKFKTERRDYIYETNPSNY